MNRRPFPQIRKKVNFSLIINNINITITVFVVTFLKFIYNYIPETYRVSKVHCVAAVLYLQSVLQVILFRT